MSNQVEQRGGQGIKFLKKLSSSSSSVSIVPSSSGMSRKDLYNGPSRENLPEAIKKMGREETVCNFCGVSYLVFSEIKELEKTIDQLRRERDMSANSNEKLQRMEEKCKRMEKERDEALAQLSNNNSKYTESLHSTEDHLRTEILKMKQSFEIQLSNTHLKYEDEVRRLEAKNTAWKNALLTTRKVLSKEHMDIHVMGNDMKSLSRETCIMMTNIKNEVEKLKGKLSRAAQRNSNQEDKILAQEEEIQSLIDNSERDQAQIEKLTASMEQSIEINKQLMKDNDTLVSNFDKEKEKTTQAVKERDEILKELKSTKERLKDVESLQEEALLTRDKLTSERNRLAKEVKEFREAHESGLLAYKKLQKEMDSLTCEISKSKGQAFTLTTEIHTLKSSLHKKDMEINGLRMQIDHQSRANDEKVSIIQRETKVERETFEKALKLQLDEEGKRYRAEIALLQVSDSIYYVSVCAVIKFRRFVCKIFIEIFGRTSNWCSGIS